MVRSPLRLVRLGKKSAFLDSNTRVPPAGLLVLAALIPAFACVEVEASSVRASVNLLASAPDIVLDQPGRVTPSQIQAGHPVAWGQAPNGVIESTAIVAPITLRAVAGTDRVLSFNVVAPTGARRGAAGALPMLRVRLNGVELGRSELGLELRTVSFAAPRAAWNVGANELEFEVDRLTRTTVGDRGVGVTWIEYGCPRPVDVRTDEDQVRLWPGTGVRYRFPASSNGTLDLTATPNGDGELTIRFRDVDARTLRAGDVTGEISLAATGHTRIEQRLPVPGHHDYLTEIELLWFARAETRLTIDRLEGSIPNAGSRTSIVVIACDSTNTRANASQLGVGNRADTPHLTQFAREAITFERCLGATSTGAANLDSILSGLHPAAPSGDANDEPRMSLADALRANGYVTSVWSDGSEQDGAGSTVAAVSRWCDTRRVDTPLFCLVRATGDGRAFDDRLGELREALESRGIFDRAIVVLVAVGAPAGSVEAEGDVLSAPLLVRLPHGANAGRTVRAPIELVDLYPTLLDWIGMPSLAAGTHGRSLVPALRAGELEPTPLISASPPIAKATDSRRTTMEYDGWKLVVESSIDGDRYQLFDLGRDPRATRDLYGTESEQGLRLREILDERLAERGSFARTRDASVHSLDARELQRLERRGYLGR